MCLGFAPGCGRGIHFRGGGRNTKCIVVVLGTSHLFLIKEAAEHTLLPSWYSSGQQVAVEPQSPQSGPEPSRPATKALVTRDASEYFPLRLPFEGQLGSFSPNLSHLSARSRY